MKFSLKTKNYFHNQFFRWSRRSRFAEGWLSTFGCCQKGQFISGSEITHPRKHKLSGFTGMINYRFLTTETKSYIYFGFFTTSSVKLYRFCLQIFVFNWLFREKENNTHKTFHIHRVAIQLHFIWLLGTTILKLLSFCLKTERMLTLKIREVWYHCIMLHPMAIWILPLYSSGTYELFIPFW